MSVCENFIPKKTVGILKKRWEQNAPDPAAERRNGLAQDVSPGSDGKLEPVPEGRHSLTHILELRSKPLQRNCRFSP
jgi:hypothetical protein